MQETDTKNELQSSDEQNDIQSKLDILISLFQDKIKTDEHKNQMFDNMHKELVDYRNGRFEQSMDSVYLDLIQLSETYMNVYKHFITREPSEEDYEIILDNIRGISYDVDDVLYRMGVETYNIDGDDVDTKKQKIVNIIITDDITKDNKVAKRIHPGYEKDGRIIKAEKIAIYKYEKGDKNE